MIMSHQPQFWVLLCIWRKHAKNFASQVTL